MKTAVATEKKAGISLGAGIKFCILFLFLILSFCLFRFTPFRHYLTPQTLDLFLDALGVWAPVGYVTIFAAGLCLAVPASMLTLVGAALFGASRGFFYAWLGALAGSSGAFFIGRRLGRDFVESIMGDRLHRYDDAIEKNGFLTVLYLRLLNTPLVAMNFGIGLTKVRFRDYFLGTALGIMISLFVICFFGGTLKAVWVSGKWSELLSPRVFLALALFIFSLFIPLIISKARRMTAKSGPPRS